MVLLLCNEDEPARTHAEPDERRRARAEGDRRWLAPLYDAVAYNGMIDAYHEPLDFEIQQSPAGGWRRSIDTRLDSPLDIPDPGEELPLTSLRYQVLPRSVVVLLADERRA